MVKNLTANAETQESRVQSLGQEDTLEEGMATHSSIYSFLKNPIDRGAWQATVHGVAKSWILLKQDSMHVHVQDCTVGAFQTWDWDPGSLASKSVLFTLEHRDINSSTLEK